MESPNIENGLSLKITPSGLEGSLLQNHDEITYFGTEPGINDYLLPNNETGFGKKHFQIKYDPRNSSYSLVDLSQGTGTFIKIDKPLLLKHNFIIAFGDSHIVIQYPGTAITNPESYNINIYIRNIAQLL